MFAGSLLSHPSKGPGDLARRHESSRLRTRHGAGVQVDSRGTGQRGGHPAHPRRPRRSRCRRGSARRRGLRPHKDLPPKAPGEFYYYEAIGCAVTTTDGRLIGVIEDVFATGANDVWVVRDGATEVLVPVIENVVKSMDLGARRMVVEAVPGLLD